LITNLQTIQTQTLGHYCYGMMNLAWIIAIAMYVLGEKLLPAQRWLPRLADALLILWGGAVLAMAWR
jgi:predicted metal-binding membrane protein